MDVNMKTNLVEECTVYGSTSTGKTTFLVKKCLEKLFYGESCIFVTADRDLMVEGLPCEVLYTLALDYVLKMKPKHLFVDCPHQLSETDKLKCRVNGISVTVAVQVNRYRP